MPIAIVSNMAVVENESYMKANSVDKKKTCFNRLDHKYQYRSEHIEIDI